MQYATIAQLQDYLDISGPDAAATANLNMALTNACAVIDRHTHRTFAASADTTRLHDGTRIEGHRLWLDGDLAQLTSVTNGDGEVIPLNALRFEPLNITPYFALSIKSGSGYGWTLTGQAFGDDPEAIEVTGRFAYSVTPPDDIVQATLRLSAYLYRQPANAMDLDRAVIVGNATIAPGAIPADVFMMLRPYQARVR
jgi:hypothetical protein